MRWFGRAWSLLCEPQDEIATPLGRTCDWCDEPIVIGESGVVLPTLEAYSNFHAECHVRQMLGTVGHQMRQCGCYHIEDLSELGLSRREAARRAWEFAVERVH